MCLVARDEKYRAGCNVSPCSFLQHLSFAGVDYYLVFPGVFVSESMALRFDGEDPHAKMRSSVCGADGNTAGDALSGITEKGVSGQF